MNDNVLKKEFTKKDVQRARNLITGDAGARTTEGVGYKKKYEHRVHFTIVAVFRPWVFLWELNVSGITRVPLGAQVV